MKSMNIKRIAFDGICFTFLMSVFAIAIASPAEEFYLQISNYIYWLIGMGIIGLLVAGLLSAFGIQTTGSILFNVAKNNQEQKVVPAYKNFSHWQMFFTLGVTFVLGVQVTHFSIFELLNEDGFQGAMRLFGGLLHPEFRVLPRALMNITETIFMAFMATALAIPFAFALSFLAAKNIMKGFIPSLIYYLIRTLMNVSRSIEALIWAIIFSVWVGIGPFAGMLALMIHSIASLTKQYSEMIETVNEGPIEGILSTGANKLQMIWFAIVPQVVLPFISFTVYRWDINVRMATIIGLVGGGGIGTMLIQYQGQAMWPEVGCIILVIAVVVWAMDQLSSLLREALK